MLVDLQDLKTTRFQIKIYIYVSSISRLIWEKVRIDGRTKLKLSVMPTIFGELVIQRNEKMVAGFIPDTESTTEIMIVSELTAEGDQESISDIGPAAEIIISNPVQEKEEFLSDTEPTKEIVVSHPVFISER